MQMSDMAGYFKKYWKDRQQIGAAGGIRQSVLGASAATGPFEARPGQTVKTPRPGRPIRLGYTEERMAARMVELAALAEQINGISSAEQVHVDKLKQEVLSQLRTKNYDQRAVAKALNKAMSIKQVKQKYTNVVKTDADLWIEMNEELQALRESDAQPDPLASEKLKDVAANGLAGFLGPAGPLFSIGHDLYKEFKEDGKELLTKVGVLSREEKETLKTYRHQKSRLANTYQRWTVKLKNGLGAVISKFRGWGSSLLDLLSGGKLFGKAGGAIAGGLRGAGRLARNPKVLAGLAAAGMGAAFLNRDNGEGHADQIPQAIPPTSAGGDAMVGAGGPEPKKQDDSSVMKSVKAGVQSGMSSLTSLFDGLGQDLLGRWKSVQQNAQQTAVSISNVYDTTVLKTKIIKDDIQEAQDKLWDDIGKWTGSLWTKFKSFIPSGVRNAASSAWSGVKSLLGIKESAKTGGDGSGNAQTLKMGTPSAGGGRGSQGVPSSGGASVTVVGGADVAGVNPAVMKNFYAMADEFYQSTGKRIQINSGKRDGEKQAQLYAANPGKAARPGYSMHEYGYALDINSAEANQLASSGLMEKYGFTRPVAGESWHIEPIAIQGQKAAIRAGKAKMEDAGAIAAGAPPAVESEGASNKQLTQSMPSATPATDAQKASQGKYKASDNYGDAAAKDSASQPQVSMPSPQVAAVASASSAVAPSAESGGYERVASRSKIIDADVEPEETAPIQQASGGTSGGIGVNSVPSYLGDLGMLNMNLGAA